MDTHRAHGDWDVEVLSTTVFLECVDIIPNLKESGRLL